MSKKNSTIVLTREYWARLILELVVVFLGVSAGFFMNNWRDQNRDIEQERRYIAGFKDDVEANLTELERFNETDSLWILHNSKHFKEMRDLTFSNDSSEALLKRIINFSRMEPNEGTYIDITNSGNLNLIRDPQLKSAIVNYHLKVKAASFVDDYFYNYFNTYVTPFVFDNYDILNEQIKDESIYRTLKFRNVLAGYFSALIQRNNAYKDLIAESEAFKLSLMEASKN